MKVLMVTDYFPPHVGGGTEKVVHEVSRRLVRMGCEVSVLTLRTREAPRYEVLDGIEVHRCDCLDLTPLTGVQMALSPSTLVELLRVCRAERPDVVHAHNIFFSSTAVSLLMQPVMKPPLLLTLHLGPPALGEGLAGRVAGVYGRLLGRLAARRCRLVTAVSRAVRNHALAIGIPLSKVLVIPNGVDVEEFSSRAGGAARLRKRVVCVGRLLFNKGVQYLVEAAPKVLESCPGTEFIVVGEGPMKAELMLRARAKGASASFRFLGQVPSVAEVLRGCDIFVRPSLTEGMPLTVLEAMACGLPVVASNVSGTPEVVVHGVNGLLVEPGHVGQLSAALTRLLQDEQLAREMGGRARASVEKSSSWDRVAALTLEAYSMIV